MHENVKTNEATYALTNSYAPNLHQYRYVRRDVRTCDLTIYERISGCDLTILSGWTKGMCVYFPRNYPREGTKLQVLIFEIKKATNTKNTRNTVIDTLIHWYSGQQSKNGGIYMQYRVFQKSLYKIFR